MKIPFADIFKKSDKEKKPSASAAAEAKPKPRPIVKPESERLSKTVVPTAMRTASAQESSDDPSKAAASPAPAPAASRTISFSPGRKATPRKDLPPAVAQALQPKVERAISLELLNVVNQIPDGLVKPVTSIDASRRILLKASELEKGMAKGKPSVSLGSIYQQAPEIFLRSVAPSDATQIPLPFDKVLEAFTEMEAPRDEPVWSEQASPAPPSPETNESADASAEPLPTAQIPPVSLETARAESATAAEPQRVETEMPLRIPFVKEESAENGPSGQNDGPPKPAPEQIPFHLPRKETGEPASERVPASSGPPVSTILVPPSQPAGIPFTSAPPAPPLQAVPAPPEQAEESTDGGRRISLALKPILQNLPAFELSGDPNEVPPDARIEFPLSLIARQLATGRIAVKPDVFQTSLPPDYRRFFSAKDLQMPIVLPLQEVLKNVPAESLRMRDDQEEHEPGEAIQTPFSTAAAEDAERFNQTTESISKPAAATPPEEPPVQPPSPLDAKNVIAQASQLPGVRACAVSFTDGLSLGGNLPVDVGAEALCAVAPALLRRFETHLLETKLGDLKAMTLHCAKSTVTFFRHANICLAALHANGELSLEVRKKLSRMAENLSLIYAQAEASHVDH